MPRRHRSKRWGMPDDRREPWSAKISLLFLLLNGFVYAGLRGTDVLVVTLLATLLALTGFGTAYFALRKVRRMGGRIGGEAVALIGYWGNLAVFILSGLMFSYALAMGVLRGELL